MGWIIGVRTDAESEPTSCPHCGFVHEFYIAIETVGDTETECGQPSQRIRCAQCGRIYHDAEIECEKLTNEEVNDIFMRG